MSHIKEPAEISVRRRVWLWAAAWGCAAAATAIPDPSVLLAAWAFPIGLERVIFSPKWNPGPDIGRCLIASPYLLYFLLTFSALAQSRRRPYFSLYFVLCAVLALNVVGCHVMMKDKWSMGAIMVPGNKRAPVDARVRYSPSGGKYWPDITDHRRWL
jgi:hypothetical protein